MSEGEGIGGSVMRGLQYMGELTIEIAQDLGSKIGGLIAAIPGLGAVGEAMQSNSKGTTPMIDGERTEIPVLKAPKIEPAKGQGQAVAMSLDPGLEEPSIQAPRLQPEHMKEVERIKAMFLASNMQKFDPQDLGTNARHDLAAGVERGAQEVQLG